jgi:hypothetical protein
MTPDFHTWPQPSHLARTFTSPCLGHEPKVMVAMTMVPNLIGDHSYLLLPWLMILHKHGGVCHAILES